MASEYWAPNLFKGRIGEAIVEAVLAEFGYVVRRAGFEQLSTSDSRRPAARRFAPDLRVQHPVTKEQHWVEVKFRSARPLAVQLDPHHILSLRHHYPSTILAFVSAYDASIYCSELESIPVEDKSDTVEVSLFADHWRPLWDFFPLVSRGERLQRLWKSLQASLEGFGKRRVRRHSLMELWPGETQALVSYLQDAWDPSMEQMGIRKADDEQMSLEELWERARRVSAFKLALALHAADEIETATMNLTMMKAQGLVGEQELLIDLQSTAAAIGLEPEYSHALAMLLAGLVRGDGADTEVLAQRLISELPDGVGENYLLDPGSPYEEAYKVDLKTAIRLSSSRFRLDR